MYLYIYLKKQLGHFKVLFTLCSQFLNYILWPLNEKDIGLHFNSEVSYFSCLDSEKDGV